MSRCPINPQIECPAARYLRREPETLVICGYRGFAHGVADAQWKHWQAARDRHVDALGEQAGQAAVDRYTSFFRAFGQTMDRALNFFQPGVEHLCHDECLILGLMAGIQNGDEQAMWECSNRLAGERHSSQLLAAASGYAFALKHAARMLLPIPVSALPGMDAMRQQPVSQTLH